MFAHLRNIEVSLLWKSISVRGKNYQYPRSLPMVSATTLVKLPSREQWLGGEQQPAKKCKPPKNWQKMQIQQQICTKSIFFPGIF